MPLDTNEEPIGEFLTEEGLGLITESVEYAVHTPLIENDLSV